MGLLDDAIRQHLELKRRHGANPSDVAKLENEAFGPVERDDALEVPDSDATAAAADAEHETAREEEVAYEEAELEAEAEWQADPAAAADEDAQPAPATTGSVRPEDVDGEAPPAADVEAVADPAPDAEPGEHDELEETPEFLQETPEHDRLWFEQKPPRDFDF